MEETKTMGRGFWLGVAMGALACVGFGLGLAFVPTTPTWTLWQLTRALDQNDLDTLTRLVDLPAVAINALDDLTGQTQPDGIPLDRLAGAMLSGRKVRTVFNDPEHPLKVTAPDLLAAWWHMRREGNRAQLDLRAGDRSVHLVLRKGADLQWKVVGIRPLGALLRIEQEDARAPVKKRRDTRLPAWA